MMELITRTARLVPYAKRPKQVPSFVTAEIVEAPLDGSNANLGTVFVVVEVLVSGRPGEDIANTIINTFAQVYLQDDGPDQTPISRFEAAIRATNNALSDCVNLGNAAWIGKLSAVIAVQAGHELHLTQTGSAEAYLYRNAANTRITSPVSARPAGPAKTFGLVASGELEASDRLLIATPALIHQLELKKLHEIIHATSPNAAIGELTELLRGADSSRIAALIIEVNTPELAALQVRADEPSNITIGAPETVFETAKVMAAPLAQVTVDTSKRAGQAAKHRWDRARPQVRRAGLAAAKISRAVLSGQRLARLGLIGLAIVIAAGIGLVLYTGHPHSDQQLLQSYAKVYASYNHALTLAGNDEVAALTSANAKLDQLAAPSSQGRLNALLAAGKGPTGAPKTIATLSSLIGTTLDKLSGLTTVRATTIVSFDALKDAHPSLIEEISGTLYAIDKSKSLIYVVNKSTNTIKQAPYDAAKLGHITASAVSSNNDGIYLATDTSSVWFYHATTGQITQVSVGLNTWETANSLASYGGNLYVLSGSQVFKHVPTITGFGAATNYFGTGLTISSPSAICVDGFIYVAGNDGLHQYYGGIAKASLPMPVGLSNLTTFRSTTADQLIGTDPTTGRIGVWSDATALTYVGQYQLSGNTKASDAIYDPAAKLYYAIAGDRLVSFKPIN